MQLSALAMRHYLCSAQVKCTHLFHSAVVKRTQVLILLNCTEVTHSDLVFCLVIVCFICVWWLWKPLTGMGPVPEFAQC